MATNRHVLWLVLAAVIFDYSFAAGPKFLQGDAKPYMFFIRVLLKYVGCTWDVFGTLLAVRRRVLLRSSTMPLYMVLREEALQASHRYAKALARVWVSAIKMRGFSRNTTTPSFPRDYVPDSNADIAV